MRSRETTGVNRRRLVAVALTCFSVTATAQDGALGTGGIRGIVRDSLGQAIIGTQVAISGSRLIVETDDSGRFELAKIRPGMMTLRFRRLGYQPDTLELLVLAGKTIPLDVKLTRLAVSLTPVVITGRADLRGWREGFYHRKEIGAGHYFTAADIDKRNPSQLTDMFRMLPGVTVQPTRGIIRNQLRFRGRRGCPPLTILDGTPLSAGEFDIDNITPFSVAAVEVYPGLIVPPQFTVPPGIGPRTCGAVVIWSKTGGRAPRRVAPNANTASQIASLLDNRQIFTAAQVDITARQDPIRPVRPIYPDALFDAQVSGAVTVEFIVTPYGVVDRDRISIVTGTHPDFVAAVREALESATYAPAMRGGYAVHQLVQHEFQFVPEASSRKRK
jgi:TonB family protein